MRQTLNCRWVAYLPDCLLLQANGVFLASPRVSVSSALVETGQHIITQKGVAVKTTLREHRLHGCMHPALGGRLIGYSNISYRGNLRLRSLIFTVTWVAEADDFWYFYKNSEPVHLTQLLGGCFMVLPIVGVSDYLRQVQAIPKDVPGQIDRRKRVQHLQ
ncbi:hypothetical protein BDW75DRAFT_214373 [Aspergillus navahoensis]